MTQPHETIDWSKFDAYPLAEVTCHCGAVYQSHVQGEYATDGPRLVSQRACPGCGSHVNARRASHPPETVTIRVGT